MIQRPNKINLFLISLLSVLSILLLAESSLSENSLSGQVINGSKDSTAVSNLKVYLGKFNQHTGEFANIDSTLTNKNGEYKFKRIKPDSHAVFAATVDFKGIRYFGAATQILNKIDQYQSEVAIYETTHSDSSIVTSMHHAFIQKDKNDILY